MQRSFPWKVLCACVVVASMVMTAGGSVASAQEPPPAAPAPMPEHPVPAGSGEGRRIVYSVGQQRVWLVEADGAITRTYLVSGHKAGTMPRRGTYSVFSKSLATTNNKGAYMRHMVRFTWGTSLAIGFHSIPTDRSGRPLQTLEQLGTPLSAGCIRQAPADAEFLYNWSPVGTPVVVVK